MATSSALGHHSCGRCSCSTCGGLLWNAKQTCYQLCVKKGKSCLKLPSFSIKWKTCSFFSAISKKQVHSISFHCWRNLAFEGFAEFRVGNSPSRVHAEKKFFLHCVLIPKCVGDIYCNKTMSLTSGNPGNKNNTKHSEERNSVPFLGGYI